MPLEQSHKCFFLQQSSFPQVQQKCSGHTSQLNTENITKTGTPGSRLIKSMIAQLYQGHFSIQLFFFKLRVLAFFFFPSNYMLLFSHLVVSDSLRPHGLQYTKLPCLLPAPGACSNPCESVMPSNHLTLCRPLLLLPSIFPSIRVFPEESVLYV